MFYVQDWKMIIKRRMVFGLPVCVCLGRETDVLLVVSIVYDLIVDGRLVDVVFSLLVFVLSDVCIGWFEDALGLLTVLCLVVNNDD